MQYVPNKYQKIATKHIIKNKAVQLCGGAGLLLDMGLGKTVSTATAIVEMLDRMEISKPLIIAPKRVAEHTWPKELAKWDHTKHLKVSVIIGTEKQRIKALRAKADVYTINRENIPWLVAYVGMKFDFDMVVIDESSSFKNANSKRFKALKKVRPLIHRLVLLTGTPSPNGLLDLWPQLYLADKGERLGKTIGEYRKEYFNPGQSKGHVVYEYNLKSSSNELIGKDIYSEAIYDRISDICVSMKAKDWLDLPPVIERIIEIDMPSKIRKVYDEFERDAVMEFMSEEITAVNAAALTGKLLQFANGAVYTEAKNFVEIHDLKIKALEEILEEANGNPLLVFYNFKHDVERIKTKLKAFKPHLLGNSSDIDRWNAGEIPFLLAHPQSAGHGLNMQDGGNLLAWFGLPWSLESYLQANARLARQGQKKSVIISKIKIKGTIDEDVIKALEKKETGQEALMQALKAKINKYS